MNKKQCEFTPAYRFTWPGKDEDYICMPHAIKAQNIARVMGFHLQLIPLKPDEMVENKCCRMVPESE